ncbi:MAG: NAD(P)/FAD-dependent oxidoreductase [Pirellulales bacterium]
MSRPSVVIVGGGFGGLACAQSLRRTEVDITLIDRRNFHLFQPLLYQVATGGLSPANIASPLRCILRKQQNAKVVMDEVKGFDLASRTVLLNQSEPIAFDYLVVATGSTHHYFGKDDQWKEHAPGLKSIEDATQIRKRILTAFEEAERCKDPTRQRQCLTFVIVGGGPTGIELAGAICELSRQTMRREFRSIDPASARVILVENSPVILERYHASLSQKAKEALLSLGAEIWNESKVTNLDEGWVEITRQSTVEKIAACTVLWAAGVKASPLGAILARSVPGLELDRAGRIQVDPFCNIPSDHQIFVIGDMAHQKGGDGNPLPGVAPVAIQQGEYVGKSIARRVTGFSDRDPFQYWDKGNMATIGRSRAVMESGKIRASGKIAWLAWLFIHIMYLARFENRVMVLFQWAWNYITRNRTARLITDGPKSLLDDPSTSPASTNSPSRSLS